MLSHIILLYSTLLVIICCADGKNLHSLLKLSQKKRQPLAVTQVAHKAETFQLSTSLLRVLTGDHCEQDDECQSTRVCVDADDEDAPCDGKSSCICRPEIYQECTRSSDCDNGEVCVEGSDRNFCFSENRAADDSFTHAGGGLSLDDCNEDSDCESPRTCLVLEEKNIASCDGEDDCFCRFSDPFECQVPGDCPFGEICVVATQRNVCISFKAEEKYSTLNPPEIWGLTMDSCKNSQGCQNDLCRFRSSGEWTPCWGRFPCFCRDEDLTQCDTSTDCTVNGEICSIVRGGNTAFCRSEEYVKNTSNVDPFEGTASPTPPSESKDPDTRESPTPDPSTSGTPAPSSTPAAMPSPTPTNNVCIDAQLLSDYNQRDLVFESHQLAKVLCDEYGSCATPGHLVSFRGESMMMKSYCALRECVESLKMVNSPRYKRGLTVESKTKGLYFTSFAARFGTKGEEFVLRSLVRMGL